MTNKKMKAVLRFVAALCVLAISLPTFAKKAAKPSYSTEVVDAETGEMTLISDIERFTSYSLMLIHDMDGKRVRLTFKQDKKNVTLNNLFHVKFTLLDNTTFTLLYEGNTITPQVKEHKNSEGKTVYSYYYQVDFYVKDELFAKLGESAIEKVSFGGGDPALSASHVMILFDKKRAEELRATAADMAARTATAKTNVKPSGSGQEDATVVTAATKVKYVKNTVDEFTGERMIETDKVTIAQNKSSLGFGVKDTSYYITMQIYTAKKYSTVSGYMNFVFEDFSMNSLRITSGISPTQVGNGLYGGTIKLACSRAMIEKLATKKLQRIRHFESIYFDGESTFYDLATDNMRNNVQFYASDFIKTVKKKSIEPASDFLAKKTYSYTVPKESYIACELNEATKTWYFNSMPTMCDSELLLSHLYYYKSGKMNYEILVSLLNAVDFKIHNTKVYLKLKNGEVITLEADGFHQAKQFGKTAKVMASFPCKSDRQTLDKLAKSPIDRVRIEVIRTDNRLNNIKENIEKTLGADAQGKLQRTAKEMVSLIDAVK